MKKVCFVASLLAMTLLLGKNIYAADLPLDLIKLPPGFKIDLFAKDVLNARSMTRGEEGTIFVGTRTAGNVYALVDENKDGVADKIYTIAKGLWMPNGVAFFGKDLYVAEINRVIRFDNIEAHLDNPPEPVVINDSFPKETAHGWKFIAFGPDRKLYVPIGVPCNVCLKDDERFGTILRMDSDGNNVEVYAKGIRNTVGFSWDPQTKDLWFTDNGRDELGDEVPPDELNHAISAGMHFGFPFCHGKDIGDPDFGKETGCGDYTPPAIELGPHVAALGMRFYTGPMFPEEYKNQIFIAEHGSWNRSKKIGYRISLVRVKDNKAISYETFAEGWKQDERAWGRPVDVLVMPDGALLVSDDHANCIYRITYKK
jgi:glucose/arabinose dehydrogenase